MDEKQFDELSAKMLDAFKNSSSVEYLRLLAALPLFLPDRGYKEIENEIAELRGRLDVIENIIVR